MTTIDITNPVYRIFASNGQGPAGPQGPTGPQGPAGAAAVLAGDVAGDADANAIVSLLGAPVDASKLKGLAHVISTDGVESFWHPASGGNVYYADMFPGVVADGVTDCTAAIQWVIDNVLQTGDELWFGTGSYAISHLRLDRNAKSTLRLIRFRGKGGKWGQTRFHNIGTDPDLPMFSVASDRCRISNIMFLGQAFRSCLSLVDLGGITSNNSGMGSIWLDHCVFDSNSQTSWGSDALVTISGYTSYVAADPTGVQCDSNVFSGCSFLLRQYADYGVRIGPKCQPYLTTFSDGCSFSGNSVAAASGGCGVFVDNTLSASLLFSKTDFQSLETVVKTVNAGNCSTLLSGFQGERCKRLCTLSGSGSHTFVVDGGRWENGQLSTASVGPDVYPAHDRRVAVVDGRHSLVIRGLDARGGERVFGARVQLSGGATLDWSGGCWPDREIIQRVGVQSAESTSRVTSTRYWENGPSGRLYETADGAENPIGTAGLYGTQTEMTLPLPRTEVRSDYLVDVTPIELIGSPAAGSDIIRAQVLDAGTVRFWTDVAPGAGNGVRFSYRARIGAPLVVSSPSGISGCVLDLDGTGMSETGGVLTGWTDNVSGRTFSVTAGAPVYTASDADLADFPSATLATTDVITSDEAASAWACTGDGSGFWAVWVLYRGSTSSGATVTTVLSSGPGFYLNALNEGRIGLGQSGGVLVRAFDAVTPFAGRKIIAGGHEGQYGLNGAADPNLVLRASGSTVRKIEGAASLAFGTPGRTLTLAGSSVPVKVAQLILYDRFPTTFEQEAVISYLERKYNGFPQS